MHILKSALTLKDSASAAAPSFSSLFLPATNTLNFNVLPASTLALWHSNNACDKILKNKMKNIKVI